MIPPERFMYTKLSLSWFELEDEKLGFVKNGWLTLIANVTLL